MPESTGNVVDKAREYYDSGDADNFYFHIWGGEDIHVGLYASQDSDESIFDASRRTVERMTAKIASYPPGTKLLDIGAGYGGSARYLAKNKGFEVTCLNISPVQNERNRTMNKEQGLADKIEVFDGSFEDLPFEANSFEVVWCQDSILHSGNRKLVFEEVHRVLRPGGQFIFTDPMQKDGVDKETLQPVLNRIHLESMGSIPTYEQYAKELGWETLEVDDLSDQLINHYSHVRKDLEGRAEQIRELVSEDYRQRMKAGLGHWIEAGKQGALTWGILHFKKPA